MIFCYMLSSRLRFFYFPKWFMSPLPPPWSLSLSLSLSTLLYYVLPGFLGIFFWMGDRTVLSPIIFVDSWDDTNVLQLYAPKQEVQMWLRLTSTASNIERTHTCHQYSQRVLPIHPPPKKGGGGFSGFDQNAQCKLMSSFVWQGCGKPLFFLFFFLISELMMNHSVPTFPKGYVFYVIFDSKLICVVWSFSNLKTLKIVKMCPNLFFTRSKYIYHHHHPVVKVGKWLAPGQGPPGMPKPSFFFFSIWISIPRPKAWPCSWKASKA